MLPPAAATAHRAWIAPDTQIQLLQPCRPTLKPERWSLLGRYPTYASFASDRLPAHYELSEDGTANMVPIYDDNRTVRSLSSREITLTAGVVPT